MLTIFPIKCHEHCVYKWYNSLRFFPILFYHRCCSSKSCTLSLKRNWVYKAKIKIKKKHAFSSCVLHNFFFFNSFFLRKRIFITGRIELTKNAKDRLFAVYLYKEKEKKRSIKGNILSIRDVREIKARADVLCWLKPLFLAASSFEVTYWMEPVP